MVRGKTQGFLSKGRASSVVLAPDTTRRSAGRSCPIGIGWVLIDTAFNEDAFLHSSAKRPATGHPDSDMDWRLKPNQKRVRQQHQAELNSRENAVSQHRKKQDGVLDGLAERKPNRLPSPGITGSSSWPSNLTSETSSMSHPRHPPSVSKNIGQLRALREASDINLHLHETVSKQESYKMLPPAYIPQRRTESSVSASSRQIKSSIVRQHRDVAYGQVIPLGYIQDLHRSPPSGIDQHPAYPQPFATPHRYPQITPRRYDPNQSVYPGFSSILDTPIEIKVSPIAATPKRVQSERMLSSPRISIHTPRHRRYSPLGSSTKDLRNSPYHPQHPQEEAYNTYPPAYTTPQNNRFANIWQPSSSPIGTYPQEEQYASDQDYMYMDVDSGEGYQEELEGYARDTNAILEKEVEDYGANTLEYKKMWQSRSNIL
jgi:hypothetical protein